MPGICAEQQGEWECMANSMPRPKCWGVWEYYYIKAMACGKYVHLSLSCMTLIQKMILFICSICNIETSLSVQFQGLYLSCSLYVPWNLLFLDVTAKKLCTSLRLWICRSSVASLVCTWKSRPTFSMVCNHGNTDLNTVVCKHCIDRPTCTVMWPGMWPLMWRYMFTHI